VSKKSIVFIIAALLVGTLIGYSVFEFLSECSLKTNYYSSSEYFFFLDSDFTLPSNSNIFWAVEAWNNISLDSVSEIRNGTLHLFYNGTIDYSYGNSGIFQGKHADDGRVAHELLVGDSSENAFPQEYVIFPKNIQSGKFWLETKLRINRIGFNLYPTVYHPNYSRVNLGITLMCAMNNEPFNFTTQGLWLDVYFAGYCLNETDIWVVPKNWSYVAYPTPYDNDIHAGYFVEEVHQQDFGKWIEISTDLGDYISKALNLITKVNIKTIRVYGIILFVECLGAYAEVEYDYVRTATRS
jgi:hypothetical protein